MMHSLEQVRTGLANPNLIARQINILYHRRFFTRDYNPGIDVIAEDWDNLVILDACRYDMFSERNTIPGVLSSRTSRGSSTNEFLKANFHQRDLTDTVYVTANPVLYRRNDITVNFHDVWNIWMEDGWDEEHGTVLPERTTNYGKKALQKHPNKRLIIHYIQPHYPFIGTDTDFDKNHLPNPDRPHFWFQLMTGSLDLQPEVVWEAYNKNLDLVLPHANELIEFLNGKSVVTSDHGNMLGERSTPLPIKEWGHPPGLYTEELVEIPWLELECKERREIVSELPPARSDEVSGTEVEQRLRDIGYVVE